MSLMRLVLALEILRPTKKVNNIFLFFSRAVYLLCPKTMLYFVSQNYPKFILSRNLRTEKEF